jgi:hypothetical protein
MIDPSNYKLYFFSGDLNYPNSSRFIEIDGINNLSFQSNISFSEPFLLGAADPYKTINAPQEIQISFDRSFIQEDLLFNYTGNNSVHFVVYDGSRYFEMRNAYLKSYSAAFSVGDLPKINTIFSSYGEEVLNRSNLALYRVQTPMSTVRYETDIPNLESIFITGNFPANSSDFKSPNYKVYSFDYSIDINRQVYYSVGSALPVNVTQISPLEVKFSINSKLSKNNDYLNMPVYTKRYSLDNYLDFDIVVSGSNSIFRLPARKAKLVGTETQISSQNTIEFKRNFIGYYGLL